MPRLTIAVLTYRRPDDIAALVPLLQRQLEDVQHTDDGLADAEVLVVDNDPDASAQPIVAAAAAGLDVAVRYVCEPVSGISAARNRALDECSGRDVLVFIDDDERPRAGWLTALLRTQADAKADAVAGRVITVFPDGTDRWIVEGGFLARAHRDGVPTGSPIPVAATNNLLLDLETVRRHHLRFDPAYGHSGGEDTVFTGALVAAGARLVWCAEAVVEDHIAAGRLTRRWVLARVFNHGATPVRVALTGAADARARTIVRARAVAAGGARIAAGVLRLGFGLATLSLRRRARGAHLLVRGAAMVAAAFGHVDTPYGRAQQGTR